MPNSQITFDTLVHAMVSWPKSDLIGWVEWRVRGFEVSRENLQKGFGTEPPDHPLVERDFKIVACQRARRQESQPNRSRGISTLLESKGR